MGDFANRDEAQKCAAIARRAASDGDFEKAQKFAQKAFKLFTNEETLSLVDEIAFKKSSWASSSRATEQGNSESHDAQAHPSQPGVRHRRAAGSDPSRSVPGADQGTPEQRILVQRILKAKDYYEILELSREASDDEIKRAYRKFALKLHPDKCKAIGAEDAFKIVSRAFSCLSDSDKRAYYDRTGYENSSAAAAAAAASRSHSGPANGHYYYADDIDPAEIFNMFFGGGAFPHAQVFRSAQFARQRAAAAGGGNSGGHDQQRSALLGLLQLLPVLLLLGVTLFGGRSEPPYTLSQDATHPVRYASERLGMEYWVRGAQDFDRKYPRGSHHRLSLERQVENEHYERLYSRCQQEKMAQHRMYTWGNREKARAMVMHACSTLADINGKLGIKQGVYGY